MQEIKRIQKHLNTLKNDIDKSDESESNKDASLATIKAIELKLIKINRKLTAIKELAK